MERRQTARIVTIIAAISLMVSGGFADRATAAGERIALTSPIIIDHNCTRLAKVPDQWITAAKGGLRVGYSHTSHGSQLVTGMEALRGEPGSLYYYTFSDWGAVPGVFLNDEWANEHAGDLGGKGDLAWKRATITMLDLPGNDRNVVMWSWCGGVSENTRKGINKYLNAMNNLEQRYPDVTFIYMTGHLDGSGKRGRLNRRNNQIRAYCRANNKVLFDFADIESFAPTGKANYMRKRADDTCRYDSNLDGSTDDNDRSWAENWVAAHPSNRLSRLAAPICFDACCAHSHGLNCILKGRAFWWMMARIAGWGGPPAPAP